MPNQDELREALNPVSGMKKSFRSAGERLMKMVRPEKKKKPEVQPERDPAGNLYKTTKW